MNGNNYPKSMDLLELKNICNNIYKIKKCYFNLFNVYTYFKEQCIFNKITTFSYDLRNDINELTTLYNCDFANNKSRCVQIKSNNNVINYNYSFKINDKIQICVINDNNEYYLSFMNNNNIVKGKNIKKNLFLNGKEKLDFNRFDYLFGLCCVHCDCHDCQGFEFKVSFLQE